MRRCSGYRSGLLLILLTSAVLRIVLAARGGQWWWYDEGRFRVPMDVVARWSHESVQLGRGDGRRRDG